MKLFALSDIHGRIFTIDDFIYRGFDANDVHHHIILLGDYFDRYEHNLEVYHQILLLKEQLGERFKLIKGNHDQMLLDLIKSMLSSSLVGEHIQVDQVLSERFLRNGGAITLQQCLGLHDIKGILTQDIKDKAIEIREFLESLEDYIEYKDIIFTHAGINENREIDVWDRQLILNPSPFPDKAIVVGHSPFAYCLQFKECELIQGPLKIGSCIHNKELKQGVLIIDNGLGNNIVAFKSKKPRIELAKGIYDV